MKFDRIISSDDRAEWLEARKHVITATDVATLATSGQAGWDEVRKSKSGLSHSHATPAMLHGIEREPIIARKLKPDQWAHNTWLVAHPVHPEYAATPDLIHEPWNAVGDIKTANRGSWKGVPDRYAYQVQWQMFVTGAETGALFVEFYDVVDGVFWPDPEVREFPIERDEKQVEFLVRTARSFLDGAAEPGLDELLGAYFREKDKEKSAKEAAERVRVLIEGQAEGDLFKYVSEAGSVTRFTPKPRRTFDCDGYLKAHPNRAAEAEEFMRLSTPKPQLKITRGAH